MVFDDPEASEAEAHRHGVVHWCPPRADPSRELGLITPAFEAVVAGGTNQWKMEILDHFADKPLLSAAVAGFVLVLAYLVRLNQLLLGTPDEIKKLLPTRWTKELVQMAYRQVEAQPITTASYSKRIPPKLERRYIITGGSGELSLLRVPNFVPSTRTCRC